MDKKIYTVIEILQLQQGETGNGPWKSQEVIIEAEPDGLYPDRFLLTLRNEKVSMLEGIKAGDKVEAQWSSNVRKWQAQDGRTGYTQRLNCWMLSLSQGNPRKEAATEEDKPF